MRAALQIAQSGKSCALLSKVFPTRSHTVSAQGGITVALGNAHDDNWQWHMYDTVKGSDYIGDQEAIEYMCKTGPEAIYELENMGSLSPALTTVPSTSVHSAVSPRTSAVSRLPALRRQPTAPVTPCCTPCINKTSRTRPPSSPSGMPWIW